MYIGNFSSRADAIQPSSVSLLTQKQVLNEHSYSFNMTHPVTRRVDHYIVGDRFHEKSGGHKKSTCKYHNVDLCPELRSYQTVTSEVINSKIKSTRLQSSNQQNLLHHFLYNRLMDYWHNRYIVDKQRNGFQKHAKIGEKVVRDVYYRFVYSS